MLTHMALNRPEPGLFCGFRPNPEQIPQFQQCYPPVAARTDLGPPGFQQPDRAPFLNPSDQRSFHTPIGQHSVHSPVDNRNPVPDQGRRSRMASSGPAAAAEPRQRRDERRADPGDEISARVRTLERQLIANRAKSAMEAETKRMATAINPATDRGLQLQHEMYAAIYAAEKNQKGGLALAGDLGVFLRNRCRRLGYMAEDITTYAQQKVAELGEDATEEQIAEVDKKILRFFQDKRVKAEEVLAKLPEWLRDNR